MSRVVRAHAVAAVLAAVVGSSPGRADTGTSDAIASLAGIVLTAGGVKPLTLVVSEPRGGFVIASPLLLVSGSVSGGVTPLTLTVNGTPTPMKRGAYTATPDIALGTATVTIRLRDGVGTIVERTLSGTRTSEDLLCGSLPPQGTRFTYDPAGNLTGIFDTSSDPRNCGCPANTCTGSALTCINGVCGELYRGVFVNTSSDPANCGSLGHSCPGIPNGSPSCANGACGIDCDYTPLNGRCIDLTSDPQNCGTPGNVCTSEYGSPTCTAGVCGNADPPENLAVNGTSAPGLRFKDPWWAGITITGANLTNVTAIEFEDWGSDTVEGSPDGAESTPAFTGDVTPDMVRRSVPFTATPTSISIPSAALLWMQEHFRWSPRRWYKLRIHYPLQGVTVFSTIDVAVSFDDLAPAPAAAPQIAGVSSLRRVQQLAGYNPSTGFIATRVDWGSHNPRPTSVVGRDPLATQHPIVRFTSGGVYIPAGLDPADISEGDGHPLFEFPYSSLRRDWITQVHHESACLT